MCVWYLYMCKCLSCVSGEGHVIALLPSLILFCFANKICINHIKQDPHSYLKLFAGFAIFITVKELDGRGA